MFTNISWSNYLIAVTVLLLGWYLLFGLRFYYKELKQIISGEKKIKFRSFGIKKLENTSSNSLTDGNLQKSLSSASSESFDTLEDAEELSNRLTQAIIESIERNISKAELQNYLRIILSEYSFVRISALRLNINELIVSECGKDPQMHLTYEQADELWEEIVE